MPRSNLTHSASCCACFQIISYGYSNVDSGYSFFSQSILDGSIKTVMTPAQLPTTFTDSAPDGFVQLDNDRVLVTGRQYNSQTGAYTPYTWVVNLTTKRAAAVTATTAAPKFSLSDTVGHPVSFRSAS